jgi:hypothetical protein
MKLIRFRYANEIHAGVLTARGVVTVAAINARLGTNIPNDLLTIIQQNAALQLASIDELAAIPLTEIVPLVIRNAAEDLVHRPQLSFPCR